MFSDAIRRDSRRVPGVLDAIRRDEALRSLPMWICAGVLITFVLSVWIPGVFYEDPAAVPTALAATLWWALVPYLAGSQVRRRGRRFDLALPLPARRLWLVHVAAVLLSTAAILTFPAVLLVVIYSPAPGELLRLAVHLGAGVALAVAVLQAARPALAIPPLSWGYVLLTVASVGGVLGILRLLGARPLSWTLVPLGLAVALAARTYRSLPAAFTLVPLAAGRATGNRLAAPQWIAAGGAGWRRRWRLLRLMSGGPLSWLGWPLIFVVGLMVAFLVLVWKDSGAGVFPITTFLILLSMFTFSILKLARLPFFDPLPIGRRALFAALIFPSVGVFALGYGVLRLVVVRLTSPDAGLGSLALVFWHRDGSGVALAAVLVLAGLPWLLLLAIVFSTVRTAVRPWLREGNAGLILLLVFIMPWVILVPADGSLHLLIRLLGASPVGTLAAWLVTVLLLLGGYVLAQASFERIELPARPGQRSGVLGLGGDSS